MLSARCREHFLPLGAPELRLLADSRIKFGGVGTLYPRYEIRRFDPIWHTLIWTIRGSGRVVAGGLDARLRRGTLWIAPAGQAHHYWIERAPWDIAWTCIAPENPWHFSPREQRVTHSECAGGIVHVVRQIAAEAKSRQAEHSLITETYTRLLQLLLKREILASRQPTIDTVQHELGRLFHQVHEHPSELWTLESLLRKSGLPMGTERFRQLCVQYFGKSPMRIVTDLRMEIARELLTATDYRIYTISTLVGYQDEYAFSAAFHRETGLAPSHYRAQYSSRNQFKTPTVAASALTTHNGSPGRALEFPEPNRSPSTSPTF